MRDEAAESLRALITVVDRLRAPGGCPWDGVQTNRSLRPYLLEETYELLEAIESGDPATVREELGDVLLQVLMHAAIAAERTDGFDIGDVADTTRAKMIHRHPHVFGDVTVGDAAEVVVNWERLKRAEKGERLSLLDGIPRALPALAYAQGVQKRPARLGFDETPTIAAAMTALGAALERVAALGERPTGSTGEDWAVADATGPSSASAAPAGAHRPPLAAVPGAEEAVGTLLFAAVALARRLRVNPEDALRVRAESFVTRFRALEARARGDGADLHDLAADQWRERWRESETGA